MAPRFKIVIIGGLVSAHALTLTTAAPAAPRSVEVIGDLLFHTRGPGHTGMVYTPGANPKIANVALPLVVARVRDHGRYRNE